MVIGMQIFASEVFCFAHRAQAVVSKSRISTSAKVCALYSRSTTFRPTIAAQARRYRDILPQPQDMSMLECGEVLQNTPVQQLNCQRTRDCSDGDDGQRGFLNDKTNRRRSDDSYRRGGGGTSGQGRRRRGGRRTNKFAQHENADPMHGVKVLPDVTPSSLDGDGTAVVWFRNDLRVKDNEALMLANTARHVVPVYVFDRRQHQSVSPHGFERSGPYRTRFLLQSVAGLQEAIRQRDSDLIVRLGITEDIMKTIAETILTSGQGPVHLIVQKEVTQEEIDMEQRVCEAIRSLNSDETAGERVRVHFVWGATLLHVDDLSINPAGVGLPPTFTQFRNIVESDGNWKVRTEVQVPSVFQAFPRVLKLTSEDIEHVAGAVLESGQQTESINMFDLDPRSVLDFQGGEREADERLDDWIWRKDRLRTYLSTRNESGNMDFSSKFSPWLALGCISPRTIYWHCKRYEEIREQNKSTYWMVFELLTRDYFRWVAAKAGNQLFAWNGFTGRRPNEPNVWKLSEGTITTLDRQRFEAWIAGKTGAPFVDAAMRELAATGFMSNRCRQNVASFLIHDLKYPDWRAGAEYFESVLIDHDAASNWGNWAYLAGVGTDPRGGRRFNVVKQAMTYDPDASFIKLWCPELSALPAPLVHEPHRITDRELVKHNIMSGVSYPRPIVPLPSVPGQMPSK